MEHRDVRREVSRRAESLFAGSCAKLKQAAPAHPCARGIPFILNISEPRSEELHGLWYPDEAPISFNHDQHSSSPQMVIIEAREFSMWDNRWIHLELFQIH